ncbi:MAG: phosphoribosyltransferase [Saprospiraceae bacterium]|nr:phosphoribosyltransferase [Saprospiraceae bacterium]
MKILNHRQICQKIKRLAYEIYEQNFEETEIILIGVNNRGMEIAQLLMKELLEMSKLEITISRLHVYPPNPLSREIHLELPIDSLEGQTVIVIDDVTNTGRTIFYAMKPIMEVMPKKVEVAVLIDRKHKAFPIKVDYVGLSLATTLSENIDVEIFEVEEYAAYLK